MLVLLVAAIGKLAPLPGPETIVKVYGPIPLSGFALTLIVPSSSPIQVTSVKLSITILGSNLSGTLIVNSLLQVVVLGVLVSKIVIV